MRARVRSAVRLAAVLGALASAPPAFGASDVVISQVYGGGGNAGATYTHDFVELFNRGASDVDVTGWTVQYASAAGTTWQTTTLSGTIERGRYYLVRQARGAGGTTPLPDPNATGAIAMSATSGKVALVASSAALTGSCPAGAADLVGYGSANCFEGAGPAPTLTNTTAALRKQGGFQDTDNNAADFEAGAPNPRNSGTAPPPPPPVPARIFEIQSVAHVSPLAGRRVEVAGVVTAVRPTSFYMQDPSGDAIQATSDGIVVFGVSTAGLAPGQAVRVVGRVSEFRPGGETGGVNNLTITQLDDARVTAGGPGAAIAPTVIGLGGRLPPTAVIEDDASGNVETSGVFDPPADAIDFYESLEGMLVQVNDAVVVGPTKEFGEFVVLPDNGAWATGIRTPRGGILYRYSDANPERVIVDDEILRDAVTPRPARAMPDLNVGDRITAPIVGPLDYSFANFKIQALATPVFVSGGLTREVAVDADKTSRLSVATFNVENLHPGSGAEKFEELARLIVENLRAPDIIGLEEIQDNNGPVDDASTDASLTYRALIGAIESVGGPRYDYRQIDPVDDADGGQPGGNIRVALLFRTDVRGLEFVDRPGGGPTTPTQVVGKRQHPALSVSPGRIDPQNPAFVETRKSLAGEFRFHGKTLFVIVNHFSSKGDDQPLFGRFQPPTRFSEIARHGQAQAVNDFVERILALDPKANVVVLGDINDFEFSQTVAILEGGELVNLMDTLPESERYSYVFEGNSQVLDQILVSRALYERDPVYDVVHVNAEFADQASDHDPQVAYVRPKG